MDQEYACVARAERACCLDEVVLANFQHLATNETRVTNPTDDAEGENEFVQAGAEEGDHRDSQQQTGKREEDVEHVTRDEAIDPAAVVPRERAEKRTDHGGHRYDDEADL